MYIEWKAIPENPNYEITRKGQVRSLPRIVSQKSRWGTQISRRIKGGLIHADPHHTGYLQIKLGGKKIYRIHQLVASAWIGPCPPGMVVSHSDDNKRNCDVDNLEYMTSPDNVKRAYKTGRLSNRGSTNGKAVLNDDIVRRIRSLPELSAPKVARIVGCKRHSVHQVRRGAWGHVK